MDKSVFNMLVGGNNSSLQQTSEPFGLTDSLTNMVGGQGQSQVTYVPETFETRFGTTGEKWGKRVGSVVEQAKTKQKWIMLIIYALVAISLIVLSGILFAQGDQNKEVLWSVWSVNIMLAIGNALLIFFDKVKPLQLVIGILQFAFYIWILALADAKNLSGATGSIRGIYIASHSLNVGMFLVTIINAVLPSTS